MKLAQKFIWLLSLCLALILAVPVLIFLWLLLGGWIIPTLLFITLATLTIISYYKDISIPGLRRILKREYLRVKFSLKNKKNRTPFNKLYLKLLYYLVLLFKSSEHSYTLIKEEVFDKFVKKINKAKHSNDEKLNKVKDTISKLKKGEEINKDDTLELENYLFQFNKHNQKKTTFVSVASISAFLMITMMSSLIFPAFFTKAATFGWDQTDWSGGADTVTTANHTSNQTGWTKFFSKDDSVDVTTTPGEIKMIITADAWTQTTDADFDAGTKTATGATDDSVVLLKPVGASCTTDDECNNSGCFSDICTEWITGPCSTFETYYKFSPAATLATARSNCVSLGGRLLEMSELVCIWNERAIYRGINSNPYTAWSNTVYPQRTEDVYAITWGSGSQGHTSGGAYQYRCVR